MANQIDNVLLDDDTTGLPRTINVGSDALFLSTDLTLQAGGILTADNIKRGTADPNVALLAGNEGDVYQRTLATTGELWVNTNGATTGWAKLLTAAGATPTWAQVLAAGNLSGGTNPTLTSGDEIRGQAGASLAGALVLRGATPSSGTAAGGVITLTAGNALTTGAGGDIILTPGTGAGGGAAGIAQVNGPKHYANSATDPTAPAPAEGDRYYNTTLEMEMRYDGLRSKWLSVETVTLDVSDQGTLNSGSYFQVGTLRMSATKGFPAFHNGTVVSIGYTRDDTDAASIAVTSGGTTISSLATAAVSGVDNTKNDNFSSGAVLGVRNDGANALTDGIVWVRLKWRV
jgi:hypothetical protein